LFAQGQELSIFGDNLLVELDLSTANLPEGSRVRLGSALLEVTPLAHTGCVKFKQRAGDDALRLTAVPHLKAQRLRGLFMKVVEEGEVATGDEIQVLTRPS
jgi:MOSC domain-containing protein YiiM